MGGAGTSTAQERRATTVSGFTGEPRMPPLSAHYSDYVEDVKVPCAPAPPVGALGNQARGRRDGENAMTSGSVYVVNEIVGTSKDSWEDAARVAIDTAAANLRGLRVAEVVKMDATVEDGQIALFRVRLNVSFRYESD